jgi:hypothetical protein
VTRDWRFWCAYAVMIARTAALALTAATFTGAARSRVIGMQQAGFGTGIYNTHVFDHGVEISPPAYHRRSAGLLFVAFVVERS